VAVVDQNRQRFVPPLVAQILSTEDKELNFDEQADIGLPQEFEDSFNSLQVTLTENDRAVSSSALVCRQTKKPLLPAPA
jgi:hypothetical protein